MLRCGCACYFLGLRIRRRVGLAGDRCGRKRSQRCRAVEPLHCCVSRRWVRNGVLARGTLARAARPRSAMMRRPGFDTHPAPRAESAAAEAAQRAGFVVEFACFRPASKDLGRPS